MALGRKMLDDVEYCYSQLVAFSFMQLSLKAALREWGNDATVAGEKEINQLHWRETFVPRKITKLTANQQIKILHSCMFIVMKSTNDGDGKSYLSSFMPRAGSLLA